MAQRCQELRKKENRGVYSPEDEPKKKEQKELKDFLKEED